MRRRVVVCCQACLVLHVLRSRATKEALEVQHVQVLSVVEVVLLFTVQVVQEHFLDSCAMQLLDLHCATQLLD